jgi:hypothetical protein
MMFLQAQAWKLATALAGIAALGLAISLGVANFRLHEMTRARDAAISSIQDPKTGFIARLATCHDNLARANEAITQQNAAIAAEAVKAAEQAAAAKAALDAAQETIRAQQAKVAELLKPLTGNDACKRMNEIDDRMKEGLK